MRPLHIVAPAKVGGLERVVELLCGGQRARGHDVQVAAVVDPGSGPGDVPLLERLRAAGVGVHTIAVAGRAYREERERVAELCRTLRPTVVHTHGYRPDVLDAPVARRAGIPTVTTVHGFTGGNVRTRLYEGLQRRSFRRFSGVVAVSPPLAESLVRSGVPARRVRVVANAWSPGAPPLERVEARRVLGVGPGAFHVGWVGRLSREKGADVLLDALAQLRGERPVVSFVGDGPEEAALRARAARLGVEGAVRWQGMRPDASSLFPAFDLFVLSSRTEGTPMVIFEAVAAGVPVVATRVGGVPAVLDERYAVLVPPDDPVALAGAILDVQHASRAALGRAQAAREEVLRRYRIDPWLDSYDAVYESSLRNP